jgi:hypothetical protein
MRKLLISIPKELIQNADDAGCEKPARHVGNRVSSPMNRLSGVMSR